MAVVSVVSAVSVLVPEEVVEEVRFWMKLGVGMGRACCGIGVGVVEGSRIWGLER